MLSQGDMQPYNIIDAVALTHEYQTNPYFKCINASPGSWRILFDGLRE